MEKYPKSGDKRKPKHKHILDARIGKSESGPAGFNYEETVKNLNKFYVQVKRQILRYQNPVTGLFPCNLSKPNEAHVRDSVYCSAAVWALSQAYKRIDDDKGRTHELGQSAVKCMRGILRCWIRQADKVEKFKQNQSVKNALHSRFNIKTSNAIYKDDEFEHLQIDCIALYLLFLVQMITSGLQIIFTTDEVTFIQNLVFYVERAYRTPDYGMWERGSKYNNGSSELHASSIGMAKAALEAVNGMNLFGINGASWSVIYIDIDAHYRNRINFDSFLPRESASKNTDASLIPTVSWPAFAVHEEGLVACTLDKASRKLNGKHGMKRFLRDGYGTVMEDRNRKYYRSAEVKEFDGIESEWPMFIAYLLIDSVYKNDQTKMDHYQEKLQSLLLHTEDGQPVLPKYYFVEHDYLAAERAHPGSQQRLANNFADKELFLWGQSIYIISQLLAPVCNITLGTVAGLLATKELDPVGRYLPAALRPVNNSRYSVFKSSPSDLVIQLVLIAESTRLQQTLATYGIQSQTPHQIEPIQIWPPSELAKAYCELGVNHKLGLSGRPARPIGGLGTAKIYRTSGLTILCYPLVFEVTDFYLSQDMELVIDDVKTELAFLGKCWKLAGRPTFCMIIREDNIRGTNGHYLFRLLAKFKRGDCDGIKVRIGRLQEFIQSACIEHLDFLNLDCTVENQFMPFHEREAGKQFRSLTEIYRVTRSESEAETWTNYQELQNKSNWDLSHQLNNTDNMYMQAQILQVFLNREGLYHRVEDKTVEDKLEALLRKCGSLQIWPLVRFISSLLGKVVDSLAPSITAILVRGKQVTIGVFGKEEEVIDKPLAPQEIKHILYSKCFAHDVTQAVLQQELIINIGKLVSTVPAFFCGILKIRVGWIIQAMRLELTYSERDKEVSLNSLSPSAIKKLLHQVLQKNPHHFHRSVIWDRQLDGALNRVPPGFYDEVWGVLARTPQGLKVAGYLLPQQPTLSDMTQYELNFSLLVEQMLSKIVDPAYRQIIVECFMVLSTILERNRELSFKNPVDLDKIVHEAFQLFQTARRKEGEEKGDDMNSFYNTSPNVQHGTSTYIAKAIVNNLLDGEVHMHHDSHCAVS